jgi:hypothetical protein
LRAIASAAKGFLKPRPISADKEYDRFAATRRNPQGFFQARGHPAHSSLRMIYGTRKKAGANDSWEAMMIFIKPHSLARGLQDATHKKIRK